MKKNFLFVFVLMLFLIPIINAEITSIEVERQQRLNFGHVLSVDSIRTQPAELIPGQPAKLIVSLTNEGNFKLLDLRASLSFPSVFGYLFL